LEQDGNVVRCLALPIAGEQILVPNAVVAEVVAADTVTPLSGDPQWLLGSLNWRDSVLPLVCMEAAVGGTRLVAGARSKIVILKALSASEPLENFAILVQGIPHQVLATEHTVALEPPIDDGRPFVAAELKVEGEQAFIPDLDAVEKALMDVVDRWQVTG
jgi:chemosensory pili system protein ChpC